MSCKDFGKSENLVYIRRTNGGSSVGGVIYSWDYYLLAALPTNDNIRYQKAKDGISPNVSLHEIGNNRYEDVKCKSVHLAYSIGGYSRSAPIEPDAGSNDIEKLQETTDNPCVLLFGNANYFPSRSPECWPWSCKRWTREVLRKCDGSIDKDIYYYQDINGNKVAYGSYSDNGDYSPTAVPRLNLSFTGLATDPMDNTGFSYDIETITKDEYPISCVGTSTNPVDLNLNKNYFYGHLYKEIKMAEKTESDISEETLFTYGCSVGDEKITLATEIFPVLCNGVCKLVIKFCSKCYESLGGSTYKVGTGMKKLIAPFWSCRINESLTIYKPTNQIYYIDYPVYQMTNPITISKATRDALGKIESKDTNIKFFVPDQFQVKNTVLTLQIVADSDLKNIFGQDIDQDYRNVKLTFNLISPDGEKSTRIGYSSFDNSTLFLPKSTDKETFAYIRFNDEYGAELPEGVNNISDLSSAQMPIYQSNQGNENPIAWRDGTVIQPVVFSDTEPKLNIFSGVMSPGEWTLQITNYSWFPDVSLQTGVLSLAKEVPGSTGIATVNIQLNGADEAHSYSDLFNKNKPIYYTTTGQDYSLDPTYDDPKKEDKKIIGYTRNYWNLCDKPRSETFFQMSEGEAIGKADKFIQVQDRCCKKCRKKEPGDLFLTFFDDAFCSELDKECTGTEYRDIDREAGCP